MATPNVLFSNSLTILNTLSFYSPIILCVSIMVFSMFTVTMEKALVYFLWLFIITFLRILVFKGLTSSTTATATTATVMPAICLTGLTEMFIPHDVTYSTFILAFTMTYFILPMGLVSAQKGISAMNYGALAFFLGYIVLDLLVKRSYSCIAGIFNGLVMGDLLGGIFLGGTIAGLAMYGTALKRYLYINEMNSNQEVCSMASKQQFRCNVYKNGELVGGSIQ